MWIGEFVRCHTIIQMLRARFPDRPVDMLSTTLTAPLTDYMPGVRQAVIAYLPRSRLASRSSGHSPNSSSSKIIEPRW